MRDIVIDQVRRLSGGSILLGERALRLEWPIHVAHRIERWRRTALPPALLLGTQVDDQLGTQIAENGLDALVVQAEEIVRAKQTTGRNLPAIARPQSAQVSDIDQSADGELLPPGPINICHWT